MQASVSPYELLCASKPKPAATVVTAYDLYSAAQQHPEPNNSAQYSSAAPAESLRTPERQTYSMRQMTSASFGRRTHYIADIHSRHNQAARSAPTGRS